MPVEASADGASTTRHRHGPIRLRTHLVLLVAAAVLPVLAVAIVAGVVLVGHERATIERDAIGRTRAAMSAIDAELRGVIATVEALATAEPLRRGDLRAFYVEARRVLASQPHWLNIRLQSASKAPLFDAVLPFNRPAATVVDHEPLERAIHSGRPAIGNVTTDPAVALPSIRVRVPVVMDGGVRYVLTVPLRIDLFDEVLRAQQLPADWVIVVVDRTRRFIARIPPRPPGDPISESFRAALARAPEGFFRGSTVEGFQTYTPYVTSALTGWVLGIAVPASLVNAGATRLSAMMAAGVAIALGVGLWLAWVMARRIVTPIAAVASGAQAIARGERPEIPPDTRVQEVRDVGRALNDAAAAVRAREAELVRGAARFEGLAAVARTLNTLEVDAALQNVVDSACTLLDAEVATLFRLDPRSGDLVRVAGGGPRGSSLYRNVAVPRGTALVGLAVERRQTMVSADVLSDPRVVYGPEMRERIEVGRHRAGLAVPLRVQERITGALFVGVLPGRTFTAEEIRLVTMFADQAAVAMANAELFAATERANRAKDEFLAMLGHELRNPLGAIASAAALLDVASASPDIASRARAVIGRQVQHLSRLVDDLLDVSRVTTGKVVLVRRPLDLGELVRAALGMWRSSGRFDRHRVTVETAPAWVDADEARMEQVVSNLVGNALKYTPPGGDVNVRVWTDAASAVLEVRDTGVGMTPELVERVFDLFVQGERTLDRAQGGLGIGLTLVKLLVEMHGGGVEAESEGLGKGACFRVRLPLVVAPSDGQAPPPTSTTASRPRRVLLIEDNDDARAMLKVQLEQAGHEVHEAADGPAGVEAARALRPDVALVDIGLPGLDGYEVARRIRASAGGTSVRLIAVSGYGQAEDRRRAIEAGFDGHVAKPVSGDQLAALMAQSTGR